MKLKETKTNKIKWKKFFKISIITVLTLCFIAVIGISIFTGIMTSNETLEQLAEKDTNAASYGQLDVWTFDYTSFETKYPSHLFTLRDAKGYEIPLTLIGQETLKDAPTVILLHGLGGDYVSTYPYAQLYLKLNYNVLAIDQRGSNRSDFPITSFGYFEKNDLETTVDYVNGKNPNQKIFVHGISMGASTAGLYSGTAHANKNISGFILDSPYSKLTDLLNRMFTEMDLGIPPEYMLFCGNFITKIKYGFTFSDIDLINSVKSCKVPTLIIGNKEDSVCPLYMSEDIYKNLSTVNKTLWVTEGEHIEGIINDYDTYNQKVLDLIK